MEGIANGASDKIHIARTAVTSNKITVDEKAQNMSTQVCRRRFRMIVPMYPRMKPQLQWNLSGSLSIEWITVSQRLNSRTKGIIQSTVVHGPVSHSRRRLSTKRGMSSAGFERAGISLKITRRARRFCWRIGRSLVR